MVKKTKHKNNYGNKATTLAFKGASAKKKLFYYFFFFIKFDFLFFSFTLFAINKILCNFFF